MRYIEIFENELILNNSKFKEWFSGSKIIDANGNPLKLYTGTSKDMDFKKFNMPKNGIWFTVDPAEASQYAIENDSQKTEYDGRNFVHKNTSSRVIPAYIKSINPVIWDNWPDELRYAQNYKKVQGQLFDKLRMQGHDAIIFKNLVIVVLGSPNQIKSAISNTNFDSKKPNIDQ